jgi:hypothetical protein
MDVASNSNEYQESLWGQTAVGWGLRLVTSPPSLIRLPTKCEGLDVSQPYRPPRPTFTTRDKSSMLLRLNITVTGIMGATR